jgi:hypothetical protein
VTDVSGARESIVPGETGFIVPVGDMATMAKSLHTLHANRERLHSMSAACIAYVSSAHDPQNYDEQLLELIKEAWAAPPAHWPAEKPIMPLRTKVADPVPPLYTTFHQRAMAKAVRTARRLFQAQ